MIGRNRQDRPRRRGDPRPWLRFNAGHALNYYNVQPIARLPGIRELHIGHSIVSRSVFTGLREAVKRDEAPDARSAPIAWVEGVIHGVGTDIVKVARLDDALTRHGARFAERILDQSERSTFRPPAHRPVCSPNVSRQGSLRQSARHRRCRAGHASCRAGRSRCPRQTAVRVFARPGRLYARSAAYVAHLSLSDEADYVVAFAIIENHEAIPPSPARSCSTWPPELDRRRARNPAAPAGWRRDPVCPQLRRARRGCGRSLRRDPRARPGLLISVDHEGGRVQRFRTDSRALPAMRRFGRLGMPIPTPPRPRRPPRRLRAGRRTARPRRRSELRAGARSRLRRQQVIGDRAFHRDPWSPPNWPGPLSPGWADAGMRAGGQALFPGHGRSRADSHVAIPVDGRVFDAVWADDIQPFRNLAAGWAV